MRKVTIIGAGNVGATIAYTLAVEGIANEIVMIDIRHEKAKGEAMDIGQGAPFFPGTNIYAGDYVDAADSDIVVITSGIGRTAGQSRLDLAQINVNILTQIAQQITHYAPRAIYLLVSNPVDIMTYVFHKITDSPRNHIIGSGTILDTSRLRSYLANHFDVSQKNIHAHVFGEHGDTSFIPWSLSSVSSVPVDEYAEFACISNESILPLEKAEAEKYVRSSGSEIIARKGATYYAVSVAAVHICKCIFSDNDAVLTVSSLLDGEYGLSDVALSMLTVVGQRGVKSRIPAKLTPEDHSKLMYSAESLQNVIKKLKF
ncbi:MAG: L-lactate dehydrogenase [Clostridia bacterium]|nr:L-lactate dehydrogenase [Clostridia bacterium]